LTWTVNLPLTQQPPDEYKGPSDWTIAWSFVDLVGNVHELLDGQAVDADERVAVVSSPEDLAP
jgi:hypothetical protein